MTVKVTRSRYDEGDVIEGDYDVWLDGDMIGTVRRHDGTPNGYWGRWSTGRYYCTTRAEAVNHLVARVRVRLDDSGT